ncbi:arylalkylamine N-acetyltransferase-like 2 [Procambarus clarkii]|uniref:arylalkylamine N-acetyltransferase-like 2 n=1 Tax=Procambarus clarkii TaxID=6728 RepID=UPI001E677516|nr:arylalkylamine N-acetyltransferase-like 2 [Procambarus clarkii]
MSGDLQDVQFFVMTPGDYEDTETLLNNHFFRRNPLSVAAKQLSVESFSPQLVVDIKKCLASGVSIGARANGAKTLAGVFLNSSLSVDEISTKYTVNLDTSCIVYRVLEMLSTGEQVFNDMKVQRVLDLFTLCVHEDFERRGLARTLLEKSLLLAKEQGHQAACVQTTNSITEKICVPLGFHTVKSLDLTTVSDDLGIDLSLLGGTRLVKAMIKLL